MGKAFLCLLISRSWTNLSCSSSLSICGSKLLFGAYSKKSLKYHCNDSISALFHRPLADDSAYVVTPAVAALIEAGPSGPGKCHNLDELCCVRLTKISGLAHAFYTRRRRGQSGAAALVPAPRRWYNKKQETPNFPITCKTFPDSHPEFFLCQIKKVPTHRHSRLITVVARAGTLFPAGDNKNLIPINIEDEMRRSYLDYAMSVIVGRALPDVRDGLKPVHRRILYGMHEMGLHHNRPTRKCAKIVGEVHG